MSTGSTKYPICSPYHRDDATINKLKLQHSNECKGLMVQIHYLKVKYTRENTFRMELAYQKQYLLLLLSRYGPDPMRIFATITPTSTSTGTAESRHTRRKWSIRSVAQTVIFISRARKAAALWSEQNSTRDQLMLALEDVRRRRAISGGRRGAPDPVGIYQHGFGSRMI
jgi:hypothetical protein